MALREAPALRRVSLIAHFTRSIPTGIGVMRFVVAFIVAAFVIAMVMVQQTQALVRVGGEIQRLETQLEVLEDERQELLAELAGHSDLTAVQRVAYTELGMRPPESPAHVQVRSLPPGISFDLPLWAAPSAPLHDAPWWEQFLRAISAAITRFRE